MNAELVASRRKQNNRKLGLRILSELSTDKTEMECLQNAFPYFNRIEPIEPPNSPSGEWMKLNFEYGNPRQCNHYALMENLRAYAEKVAVGMLN